MPAASPRRIPNALLLTAALMLGAIVAVPSSTRASSGGIIGFSGKQSATLICNSCHAGGSAPEVEFEGPGQLAPGAVGTYVFRVISAAANRQIAGGFNVAAGDEAGENAGVLDIEASEMGQFAFDELTHTQPKLNVDGVASWTFTWTAPTQPGTYTLFGAGNSVNRDDSSLGDRAAATTFDVLVGGLPTATATPSPSPSVTVTRRPVPCVGDCDEDGAVTVDELLIGVSIALEHETVAACPEFNIAEDNRITVDELVAGLSALLNPCTP